MQKQFENYSLYLDEIIFCQILRQKQLFENKIAKVI